MKSAQLILKRLIQVCSCIVAVTDSETLKKALIILICAWIVIKKNVYRPQVDFSVSDLACKILHPRNRQPDICLTSRQCADDNTANLQ